MKPQSSKLQQQQKEATAEIQQSQQQVAAAREFQTPEEVLRADAAQTVVPESVKARLAESLAKEPPPKAASPWWKRLLPE